MRNSFPAWATPIANFVPNGRAMHVKLRPVRSDEELLEAWREGDRSAGNELFQRHFEPIRRFFTNKVDREVEELVQSTFTRCVEARDRYQGRSSFRTFLFAVAHNVLREFFRAKDRNRTVDFDSTSAVDLGVGPATALGGRREQRVLLEALRRIPIELQVVLELYYWEQLSGSALGEVLGVPEDTARSRIRRAKQELAKALARIDASPDVLKSTVENLPGWAAKVRASLEGAEE